LTYLLDTNAVSALMKGEANVVEHLKRVTRSEVSISQPVVTEIAYGLARLPKSKRRDTLSSRFELLRSELGRAAWSDAVSDTFGAIKAELERRATKIEDFDLAVAAHALVQGSVLVTANVKHLARVPELVIEDWSQSPSVR
jgi:tRNA(fMet)-specific endonuclease VapC